MPGFRVFSRAIVLLLCSIHMNKNEIFSNFLCLSENNLFWNYFENFSKFINTSNLNMFIFFPNQLHKNIIGTKNSELFKISIHKRNVGNKNASNIPFAEIG